jgi:hypothetical protein
VYIQNLGCCSAGVAGVFFAVFRQLTDILGNMDVYAWKSLEFSGGARVLKHSSGETL